MYTNINFTFRPLFSIIIFCVFCYSFIGCAAVAVRNTNEVVLTIADVEIDDDSGNGQIEPEEIVTMTARIHNKGKREARRVTADVRVGENMFLITPNSKTEFLLGNLKSGKSKDIVFTVFTNNKATSVPINIILKEELNAEGFLLGRTRGFVKTIPLDFPLNKPQMKATELMEREKSTEVAARSVDVDLNIPKTNMWNPDAVAVVIGISRYQNRDVPAVDYGKRDAAVMKQYLVSLLGFDERRIIELYDHEASLAAFKRVFEEQLPNWVRAEKSDVFVYYSGHGVPDPESQEAFFAPYDCNPTYAKSTGYKVKEFYKRLAKLKARNVTAVIDACFSGSSDKGMLLKGVSPVFIKVENPLAAMENGIVFTSSTAQQVASWYHDKKHGLFTFYFLKGLRGDANLNGDKKITVEEMERYLNTHVPDQARYLNNREQTPQVMGWDKARVLVRY